MDPVGRSTSSKLLDHLLAPPCTGACCGNLQKSLNIKGIPNLVFKHKVGVIASSDNSVDVVENVPFGEGDVDEKDGGDENVQEDCRQTF